MHGVFEGIGGTILLAWFWWQHHQHGKDIERLKNEIAEVKAATLNARGRERAPDLRSR